MASQWTLILSPFVFTGTALICLYIRKNAVKLGLIDQPNERSSHKIPTPRGAGISFVISIGLVILFSLGTHFNGVIAAYLAVPLCLSVLGFADDFFNLNAKLKFLIQLGVSATFSLGLLFYQGQFQLLDISLHLFYIPFIMWLTNLFNFMDGIDGIAGSQGLISGTLFYFFLPASPLMKDFSFFLVLGCLAFLIFNWHPAKVFMGDVGSCFLGSALGVLGVFLGEESSYGPILGAMFVGPFVIDATYTLMARFFSGQKVMSAHRSHLYQKLVNDYGFRVPQVVLFYILYNILIFLPLALLSMKLQWWMQIIIFAIGSLPFLFFARRFGAGRLESP